MEYDKKKTETWILQMQEGNRAVYDLFYEEWYPKAFYIALAITHNEADAKDVAQDTMIQVHDSIQDLRDPGYFKLWLNRIIISKCNRIFRKRKASTMNDIEMDHLHALRETRDYFLPESSSRKESDEHVLAHLLYRLQPKYREVLAMMYFEQLSIKEITEILKVPEGTVKSRLNSARIKLRAEIEAYEAKEGIAIDFHGLTLDAMLVSAYIAFVKPKGMNTAFLASESNPVIHTTKPTTSWLHNGLLSNFAIAGLVGVVAVGSGMALREYNALQTSTPVIDQSAIKPLQNSAFQEVNFKDITVHNSKDAYYILMKYAHCEYERAQLNDEEKVIIENIEEQLKENSEIYENLYEISTK